MIRIQRHLSVAVHGIAFIFALAIAAPALAQKSADDKLFKGDAVCTGCHDGDELLIGRARHGTAGALKGMTCQTCHGQSTGHVNTAPGTPGRPGPDRVFGKKGTTMARASEFNEVCLGCHQKDTRRLHWVGSPHEARDVACVSCHTVHTGEDKVFSKATQPEVCFSCHKSERAQIHRISTHPIAAGKVVCSDCHNPHGSTGPKQLVKNTVNETCYMCHAEKRGPFLFEHVPVADDCLNCHTPHGSTSQPLLKARAPWLCQQCHGDGAPHPGNVYSGAALPGGPIANVNAATTPQATVVNPITGQRITWNNPLPQQALRGCVNCHSQIHGSNNPGGFRFLR